MPHARTGDRGDAYTTGGCKAVSEQEPKLSGPKPHQAKRAQGGAGGLKSSNAHTIDAATRGRADRLGEGKAESAKY
jgi:hypothetical protein